MTLSLENRVRLRIQDIPAWFDETRYGDGTATVFDIPYRNLTSASAYVPGVGGWTATGCTINPSGFVAFSGVISANSAWRVRGVQSVFSDAEIGDFTALGGTVAGAALEAVNVLMFDGLKRAKWAAPDGSTFSDVEVLGHLQKLYDQLSDEVAAGNVVGGGFASWAEGQADW